jgi:hypothetical protein
MAKLSSCLLPVVAFVAAALGSAQSAKATPCTAAAPCVTTFSINLIYGTDTFEDAGGAVLFTREDLYVSNGIGPSLEDAIVGDPTIALPPFVTSNLGDLITSSDYVFLTTATPGALLTASGTLLQPVVRGPLTTSTDLMVSDLTNTPFDGSVVSDVLSSDLADTNAYLFAADNGSDYWEGIVLVSQYDLNLVEQQVPEPPGWLLFVSGLFILLSRLWQGRFAKGRV